ncbi:hypothetical protein LTR78_008720 [Recurvomyces mirabilis]|uniref:Uncharacterized protein n=1 Tax=Recurvomyces mirabilis TaxID=574656 RepID=A0AAE0WFM4_9PEZI|nr:hypothetical protein LTR78_008720 [Recurvomyces mirabilis]KAK5159195.1 hypothetical protein LTS14_002337 [Recurvomyces mirabilis]
MTTSEGHHSTVTPRKTSNYLMRQMSMPASRSKEVRVDSPRQAQLLPTSEEDVDAKMVVNNGTQPRPTISTLHPNSFQKQLAAAPHQTDEEEAATPFRQPSATAVKSTSDAVKPALPVNRRLTFTSSPSQARKLSVPPITRERSIASPSPLFVPLRSKSPTLGLFEDRSSEVPAAKSAITTLRANENAADTTSLAPEGFAALDALSRSTPTHTRQSTSAKQSSQNSMKRRISIQPFKTSPAPETRRINPKDLPWDDKETLHLWQSYWDPSGNELNRSRVRLIRANAHTKWRQANGYGSAHRNWITLEERMEDIFESGVRQDELRARVEESEREGGVFPKMPGLERAVMKGREKTFAKRAEEAYRKSKTPAWKEDFGVDEGVMSKFTTPAQAVSVTASLFGHGGSKASASTGKAAMKRSVTLQDPSDQLKTLPPLQPNPSKDAAPTKKIPAKRRAPNADILDQAITPALLTTPAKRAKRAKIAPVEPESDRKTGIAGERHNRATSPLTAHEEISAMAYFHQARLVLRKHCKDVFKIDGRVFDAEVAKWAEDYVERIRREM